MCAYKWRISQLCWIIKRERERATEFKVRLNHCSLIDSVIILIANFFFRSLSNNFLSQYRCVCVFVRKPNPCFSLWHIEFRYACRHFYAWHTDYEFSYFNLNFVKNRTEREREHSIQNDTKRMEIKFLLDSVGLCGTCWVNLLGASYTAWSQALCACMQASAQRAHQTQMIFMVLI